MQRTLLTRLGDPVNDPIMIPKPIFHLWTLFSLQGTYILICLNISKGQLNSECFYEVIFSPKMQTKNYKISALPNKQGSQPKKLPTLTKKLQKRKRYNPYLFCRAEILVIFCLHFGRNNNLIYSF